jgi:NAD-dependent dihydropyrimidine dehydrogenase PreA subunit
MDVIRMDEAVKKAIIRYPEECMCCAYCELDCSEHAIYVSPEKYAPLMVSWC